MSDKMRWRYGDTNPVVALCQETDDAKPASDQTDQGTELDNQETLADGFLGVAMQRSAAGDTAPIRVATTGVFEFDCPSGTFELGDLVGVDENSGGDGLLDQQVDSVALSVNAVGRVTRREATAVTSVLIDIRSTVMTGGIEGSSPSGV